MDFKALFPNFPALRGAGGGGGGGSLPYPTTTGTLAAILAAAVPAVNTRAVPNNVRECTLESNGTAWLGCVGNFATDTERDTAIGGNTGNLLANRTYALVANNTWVWTGSSWGMSDSSLVASGITTQYLRGDKSWAELTTAVVLESGNLYFTDARARAAFSGVGAISYTVGTGAFTHQAGDGFHHIPATGTGSAGKLLIPGATAGSEAWVTVSGDATLAASGALTLAGSGVVAGTYGSATEVPVVVVDAKGRVTGVTTTGITASGIGAAPAFVSAAANLLWATPDGSAGVPSLRSLVSADIPGLPASKITSGAFADAYISSAATWNAKLTSVTDDSTVRSANTFYSAPNGASGVAGFRALASADLPSSITASTTGGAAYITTARTLTIGGTGKDFDGSAAVSWSLAEIGALAASLKGTANGVAELGPDGRVLSSQLPAYVDDVLEFADLAAMPATGESGKIYIALDTNLSYRWSGSVYVSLSTSVALGETSATAYRGDRGKIGYDHSQIVSGNPHGTTFAQLVSVPDALTAIGGLTPSANTFAYYTGAGAASLTSLSAFARTLLDDVDAAAMLATLGAAPAAVSGAANLVWATPDGSAGVPSLRSLVAADIPGLATSKITSGTFADAMIASAAAWNAKLATVTADTTSRAANTVYSAPDGAAGTAAFRALALPDLPEINLVNITGRTVSTAAPAGAPTAGQVEWLVVEA